MNFLYFGTLYYELFGMLTADDPNFKIQFYPTVRLILIFIVITIIYSALRISWSKEAEIADKSLDKSKWYYFPLAMIVFVVGFFLIVFIAVKLDK